MMELLIYLGMLSLYLVPAAVLSYIVYRVCIRLGILEELLDEDDV